MFPLPEQPTWAIKDSSKLSDYQRCARYYFYRYILGWDLDFPDHDLLFGEAWHKAREHQLIHGYADIGGAYEAFNNLYRLHFPPEEDDMRKPKTPTGVLHALMKFNEERARDLIDNEVVVLDGQKMTEISGTVPVDDHRCLHYRMDTIMRRLADDMIFSWDHKTTHEKWIITDQWSNQFFNSLQNGTYTHCLYCLFPIDKVLGIEFCGTGFAFLQRSSAQRSAGYHATLKRVPAFRAPEQMNSWLWTVNDLLDNVERDMNRLMSCSEGDDVLCAFPMNGTSCTDYKGCMFHDYCLSWPNPLRSCYEPPLGFTQKFWNPAEKQASVVKNLGWR